MKRNHNDNVIFGIIGVAEAKIVMRDFSWYVEKLTTSPDYQQLVVSQIVSEIQTEVFYEKRTVFREKLLTLGVWTFEIRIKVERMYHVGNYRLFGLERDKFDEQTCDNSSFDWSPVSYALCLLRSDR